MFKKILNDDEINQLSYEVSFSYLEEVIEKLENTEESLENAIKYYEFGIRLKNHCDKKLKSAELKIQKVIDKNNIEDFEDQK